MAWQPIETAPKDRTVFISFVAGHPCFACWATGPVYVDQMVGKWPFRRQKLVETKKDGFWRADYVPHAKVWGIFQLIKPAYWMPLPPDPPE